MAYVQPSGTIQLIKGVNIDNRYAHTIYFASESAQNTFFTSKVAFTFSNQYYTRHNENTIRIKTLCDAVADCTYLRFQNRPNGKWYYAFINSVNYINENVTEIIYEIDVMQTWFIQTGCDIKPCFVDREHVSDDTFGIYHAPDTPATDEYVYHYFQNTQLFTDYDVNVQISTGTESGMAFDNNSYMGCRMFRLDENASTADAITTFIQTALGGSWDKNQQSANIVDLYSFPSEFNHATVADNTKTLDSFAHPTTFYYADNSSYTPKNKRLLAAPYCYLFVTDFKGENSLYQWEQFTDPSNILFRIIGNPLGGGSILAFPLNYAGELSNYDSGLFVNNFPKRAFSYDAYSAWVAAGGMTRLKEQQTLVNMQGVARGMETVGDMFSVSKTAISAAGTTAAAMATGGLATPVAAYMAADAGQKISQASANAINRQVAQREAQNNINYTFKDAKYAPDIVMGNISSDIPTSSRFFDFNFHHMYPRKDEAIRIDDFFSTFGYSIKEVKTPRITGRKHWNFIKTMGAVIGGDMPSTSKQAIADIFDSGIFFWKNGNEVGNFRVEVTNGSINNPIV